MSRRAKEGEALFTVDLSEEVVPGGKVRVRASGEPARYDPAKVRARAEEALGWEPGSSRDMTFAMLREALKAKPEKWKAAKDIDDMLRTGEHLIAKPEKTCRQCFQAYEITRGDDGFCSDTCMKQYDLELG